MVKLLPIDDRYLAPPEAAHYLGISTKTLRRWKEEGRLPFTNLGENTVRYRLSDLINYMELRSQRRIETR